MRLITLMVVGLMKLHILSWLNLMVGSFQELVPFLLGCQNYKKKTFVVLPYYHFNGLQYM